MKYVKDTVATKEKGTLGTYECPLFESLKEAQDYLGESIALAVLNKAWKVMVQAVARRAFLSGASPQEVSERVKAYKPGEQQKGIRQRAAEAISKNAKRMSADPKLREDVTELLAKGDWKGILERLEK
ncbi:MAG: hypothetical protein DRG33_08055 [Deltaproteobacteria bacterium]|nr:MAG: hypothetical protein DRG33_08055 [Deltaproteobacteria bacterium]